ncbi:MAG: SpoIIE family protein phosphatase [Tepidisphaerales bacterium]
MAGLIAAGHDLLTPGEPGPAYLLPIAGPPIEPLELVHTPGGLVLGRGEAAQLKLPVNAEKVSRAHCRFNFTDGQWTVTDSSRWGTYVNGVKLAAGQAVVLRDGDTLRVAPWTFGFSLLPPQQRGLTLAEDAPAAADIRPVDDQAARQLGTRLVDLLTTSTERLYAARSERELAEALLDVALSGTGMTTGAVLKVVDFTGRVEPIASRQAPGTAGQALYSRSLVNRARQGQVAELRVDAVSGNLGESVVQMKISSAICAPLLVGEAATPAGERDVAALLYLDARAGTSPGSAGHPHAAGFVMALARMGSLALANLKRLDMLDRERQREHDEKAAAEAQRLILPAREGRVGRFRYVGESRPGQTVGGDFFDVVPLSDDRLAVALGDVTGKGVPASVLMTASFGFLHSLLESGQDVATAARMLTRFLHPRRPASRFVTLWVGVFDLARRTLTYVDCGHGWAVLQHADGHFEPLDTGGGLPIGINDDWDYAPVSVPLEPGARAVIVSDGFVEQFGLVVDASGRVSREQFGMEGVHKALATAARPSAESSPAPEPPADELKALYDAVIAFAGTPHLADDATAILVSWD